MAVSVVWKTRVFRTMICRYFQRWRPAVNSGFEKRSTILFSIVVDGHKCLWVISFGGHRIALIKSSIGIECCFLTKAIFPFFANRVGRPADCRCVQQRTLLYWTRKKRVTTHVVQLQFFNDSRWTFESIRCCWEVAFSQVPEQMEQNLFIWVFRLIVAVFLVFLNYFSGNISCFHNLFQKAVRLDWDKKFYFFFL